MNIETDHRNNEKDKSQQKMDRKSVELLFDLSFSILCYSILYIIYYILYIIYYILYIIYSIFYIIYYEQHDESSLTCFMVGHSQPPLPPNV
jgi:hypothetical protein